MTSLPVCVFISKPYLHVHRLLRVLPHQAVGHYDEVSRLTRCVRGQGGGRVTDGTLQVQRAAGQRQCWRQEKTRISLFISVRVFTSAAQLRSS